METWMFLAIISLFMAGFQNFGMKIIAKRNYDTSLAAIIMYSTAAVISGCYYFFIHKSEFLVEGFLVILLFAVLHRISLYISTLARVEGLRNIDTTIFFPLYKTFFPILMTATGIFYFSEKLDLFQGMGILIGIMIPLLLITKVENTLQKNMKAECFLYNNYYIKFVSRFIFCKNACRKKFRFRFIHFSGVCVLSFSFFIELSYKKA